MKKNEINKKIGQENLQLLEAITTVQSSHNPIALEKVRMFCPVVTTLSQDYIERKRIVERLRLNSSPTTLHLLAAPPVLSKRPKSGTRTLVSRNLSSIAPKERPKSAGSLPSWFSRGGDKGKIYPSSAFSSTGLGGYPEFPSPILPTSQSYNEDPKIEGKIPSASLPSNPQNVVINSTEGWGPSDAIPDPGQEEQRETAEISRPRKVLLSEIDMRGVVVTPSLMSPKSRTSNQMKLKTPQANVPFPHSAVFIVRVYDVGRTIVPISSPHIEAKVQSYSSGNDPYVYLSRHQGLVVESKLLPETEKSIAYEFFLPLKQLKLLVDTQPSSIYDSLGRKLRRLKCVNRETGLVSYSSESQYPRSLYRALEQHSPFIS